MLLFTNRSIYLCIAKGKCECYNVKIAVRAILFLLYVFCQRKDWIGERNVETVREAIYTI